MLQAEMSAALVELIGVRKDYAGTRALRIRHLSLRAGDRIVLAGLDAGAAEVFIHLITGAALADEGDVRIAGTDTRAIATDTEWLASLDRFGIVTDRAVLIDGLPTAANLALPLTLAIHPMSPETRGHVDHLAAEVGLQRERLDQPASTLTPDERVRVHLARALAMNPSLLILERPTARIDDRERARALGATVRALSLARGLGWIALTDDDAFARASAGTRLRLEPETGELVGDGFWRGIFRRR
jgi:predicted ABC-type transport system involved in lysophospholipase L1 biosynthesis ATPase subunit